MIKVQLLSVAERCGETYYVMLFLEIVCSGSNELRNINTRWGWRWNFSIFRKAMLIVKETES
jgi:hypothetical protein